MLMAGCNRITSEVTRTFGETIPPTLTVAEGEEIDADFHLLSRAAFGPWPGDLERVRSMGREAWVEQQLQPEGITDTLCDLRAERFESSSSARGTPTNSASRSCVTSSPATPSSGRSTADASFSR